MHLPKPAGEKFNKNHVLHELKHFLPSQTPIKDFIHHNSLHAYQHLKFYDGIFKASKIFGYQVTLGLQDYRALFATGRIRENILDAVLTNEKGAAAVPQWKEALLHKKFETHNEPRIGQLRAEWKRIFHTDPDHIVHPLLFRILTSYLDQGIASWKFPVSSNGFLDSLRELEKNGWVSILKTSRARKLLMDTSCTMERLLSIVVGDESYFEQYIFDQQFAHQGWSGMVAAVEDAPHTLLDHRPITLEELIIFELILEIDALEYALGNEWAPLSVVTILEPQQLFSEVPLNDLQEVFKLWQLAFEWTYYDEVLSGIATQRLQPLPIPEKRKSFQAIFCIDERECSLRRHIENADPECETLGTPGFFGVEFYFQAQGAQFYEKLCPAPVTPKYLIKEINPQHHRAHELLYTPKTNNLVTGIVSSLTLGFYAGCRLMQNLFSPKMSPAISDAYAHMHEKSELTIEHRNQEETENNLQIGFTVSEMSVRVESLLRSIGLTDGFSSIVYVVAHGSSSANNPHHSAHDCGACSGRPGSVNARVFAYMANHPAVRAQLKEKGIDIPFDTTFIGSMHDTAADQIAYYDDALSDSKLQYEHTRNKTIFEKALDFNAKERSRRFASINTRNSLATVRRSIFKRSASMFEPRPELGHGTNTLCIIGRRDITKGLFLDRRAFLNSYDYRTDPDGKLLTGIMRPIGPVCGGINLEYYFSRVDNYKLGAGTKLPHNVAGLIGVTNSSDGDLRPGLPVQMIEVHDPVRLLVIVEHYPEVVLNTIQSAPEMYEWYINEWVHIVAIHPQTGAFYYFKEGAFTRYSIIGMPVPEVKDVLPLIESAKEMETNYIVDATKENLPVYQLN